MSLKVSTTSSDVLLADLGVNLVHPTVGYDLTELFTPVELRDSLDLTSAVQAGTVVVNDGQFEINSTDYDPNEVLNQELKLKEDQRFVSYDELRAGHKNALIFPSVFPVPLNSTASTTKNVYCPAARWGTWSLHSGDIVEITGSTAADGTYTVDEVLDHQNFSVIESILDSIGGDVDIYHPVAAESVGVNPNTLNWATKHTLQEVLEELDPSGTGITEPEHRTLDQLVHIVAEDSFDEITYSGNQVTSLISWTDNGKTTKIREELYSYTGNKINTLTLIQYNALGVEVERIVETYNYTGNKIVSIDRELI